MCSSDLYHAEKLLDKQERWWNALNAKGWVVEREGEFRKRNDGKGGEKWHEKMTDVALASRLIADCANYQRIPGREEKEYHWKPEYDEAVLLSQDTDFVPAVRVVSKLYNRRVHVLLPGSGTQAQKNAFEHWREEFPPKSTAVTVVQLTKADFEAALLPKFVKRSDGHVIECHPEWAHRTKS